MQVTYHTHTYHLTILSTNTNTYTNTLHTNQCRTPSLHKYTYAKHLTNTPTKHHRLLFLLPLLFIHRYCEGKGKTWQDESVIRNHKATIAKVEVTITFHKTIIFSIYC